MTTTVLVLIFLVLAISFGVFFYLGRPKKQTETTPVTEPATSQVLVAAPSPEPPEQEELPQRLVIGSHPNHPVVTIESSNALAAYKKGKPIDLNSGSVGRLTAMLQAAPGLLVAAEASGERLMEVTINGDLARAADGNGFRAFALGPKGITEQARLFEVQNLQQLVNAAAVWQIASVVVAQKHLADISQKLDEIKNSVKGISQFLDNQRKARIQSTYEYLAQVYRAIQAGELSTSVRIQLESCERDLLEIHRHLIHELCQLLDEKVEHSEAFGSKDLKDGISSKIGRIKDHVSDIQMCLRTRIGAWHILSVFPGEANLSQSRRESIEASVREFAELEPLLRTSLDSEIDDIKAFWTKQSTLDARKSELRTKRDTTTDLLSSNATEALTSLKNTEQQFLTHDQPTRIFIEVQNGVLVAARQAT
ncbi:MAG: hypothetical protein V4542_04055 [Pseudomonadota bacterium]